MTHESIYDITYSCNKVVCHEEVTAYSVAEAIDEFYLLIEADYVDILGIKVSALPLMLQRHNL